MEIRILGICGSLRENSISRVALEYTLQECHHHGAKIDHLDLRELSLPYCNGEYDLEAYPKKFHRAIEQLRKMVKRSHGVILATPEYHGGLSGVLKNALDLLDMRITEGKVVGLIAAAGPKGGIQSVGQMRLICRNLFMNPVPQQVVLSRNDVPEHGGGPPINPDIINRIQRMSQELVKQSRIQLLGKYLGNRIMEYGRKDLGEEG